jgi:hypothetical protein
MAWRSVTAQGRLYLLHLPLPLLHDLYEENHERRLEARVQALFQAVEESPPPSQRSKIL